MNTPTRYFIFFLVLFAASDFFIFKTQSDANLYTYSLLLSLVIPLALLPLYRTKAAPINPSVLMRVPVFASRCSKIGFFIGGLVGFIYSAGIINVCSGPATAEEWCFSAVGIFMYSFLGALAGFALGAAIGGIFDYSKSRR